MREINKLCKIMVKDDKAMEKAHRKHYKKRARILKHAMAFDKKLLAALRSKSPTLDLGKLEKMAQELISNVYTNVKARAGRVLQNPVSRKVRRIKAREANV